jgi:hypothetical protein
MMSLFSCAARAAERRTCLKVTTLPPSSFPQYWRELATAALLGTERQGLPASVPEGPLAELLARLDASDREGALLGAAAAVALYRRVGRRPAADPRPLPAPCDREELPRCSGRAARHLTTMLRGEWKELLPEWLTAAAVVGQRVSEECLPDLLDLGRRDRDLRAVILPVLGHRGSWLAGQNPDWSYAVGGDSEDEAVWELGEAEARRELFRRLRAVDPARARALASSTWAEESPSMRAAILSLYRIGLSQDDEPFLETGLDDRHKPVRAAAAEALACLPTSRLCQRMAKRVRSLLSLPRQLGDDTLEVTLPEICDPAMVRDGIEPKPRFAGLGEKADRLTQMLGAVPPSLWSREWDRAPAQLVRTARRSPWKEALLLGWTLAAARTGDEEWAAALLAGWLEDPKGDAFFETWKELAGVVPAERLADVTLPLLEGGRIPLTYYQLTQLLEPQGPWSVPLTNAMLTHVRRHMLDRGSRSDPYLPEFLARSACSLHSSVIPEVIEMEWSVGAMDEKAWAKAVDRFLSLLRFRHQMLKEFTS